MVFRRLRGLPGSAEGERRRDDPGLEKAGVTVKVVTGDNELVSRHVFAEIGVPGDGRAVGRSAGPYFG